MNRSLVALLASLLFCAALASAQLTIPNATKDDWEEINFETDSAILIDGFPSLLRLAELLSKNPEFKVRLDGNCDIVGEAKYNEKLSVRRGEAVKAFLLKYGARDAQIEVIGKGQRTYKVDNGTKEGRFMNRRVGVAVFDGKGGVVSAGNIGDAIKAMQATDVKQDQKMDDILRRLDKLDEILALVKQLKTDNDQLKVEIASLRTANADDHKSILDAIKGCCAAASAANAAAAAPVAVPPPGGTAPAGPGAGGDKRTTSGSGGSTDQDAANNWFGKSGRFSVLGANAGVDRNHDLNMNARARYFQPFGSFWALQAQGEYQYFRDRQEGQFDIGMVNRFAKHGQIGAFSSFRHVDLRDMQNGTTLGQASLTVDYIFNSGRFGLFGAKGFMDKGVINRVAVTPTFNIWEEKYLKIVDQLGFSAAVTVGKNTGLEGNIGWLRTPSGGSRPGGMIRLIQPVSNKLAFTVETGYNESMVNSPNNFRVAAGVQVGNFTQPKEYMALEGPVPVDIPRVRYELLTRRVRTGKSAPVADAGPDQIGIPAGLVTLDGSASFDPDGDPLTYQWDQVAGASVALTGRNTAKATFTGEAGQGYSFRLTVKNTVGLQALARVNITVKAAPLVKITQLVATPPFITLGGDSVLSWQVDNADSVTITPGVGTVNPVSGSVTVTPTDTTTYSLTAKNAQGSVTQTVQVTVIKPVVRILAFTATPSTIGAGQSAVLNWQVEGADSVTLSGVGEVNAQVGSVTVNPTDTTIYTLTAKNGQGTVTQTVQVTVNKPTVKVLSFTATPSTIAAGQSSVLTWQVQNADSVNISGVGPVDAKTGNVTVTPTETTTYTLTAKNAQGTVTMPIIVTVSKPIVKILSFNATPSTINSGQSTVLSWQVLNADSVTISGGIGAVTAQSGNVTATPTETTTYTLTAKNAQGTVTQPVLVTVIKPVPKINTFTATPTNIEVGQTAVLTWNVEGVDKVTIDPLGEFPATGSTTVTPSTTTTYKLTATNLFGTLNATVVVSVGSAPVITSFTATKTEILDSESTTLSWSVTGATEVFLLGIGQQPATGSITLSPKTTTTFTLAANNGDLIATAKVTIKVIPTARLLSFTATGTSTQPGDPVTLYWTTENAVDVTVTPIGKVLPNSAVTVFPEVTTTYTITVNGVKNSVTQSLTVTVPGTTPTTRAIRR